MRATSSGTPWQRWRRGAALLLILPAWLAAAAGPPADICQLLGGRSDRGFVGRPGNL